jgi:hypothetical protein
MTDPWMTITAVFNVMPNQPQDRWSAALDHPDKRAAALLDTLLTPEQRLSWKAYGLFDVVGRDGTRYRIHQSTRGGMKEINPAGHYRMHCVYLDPQELRPADDHAIGMLLYLRGDEALVRNTARPASYWTI